MTWKVRGCSKAAAELLLALSVEGTALQTSWWHMPGASRRHSEPDARARGVTISAVNHIPRRPSGDSFIESVGPER